MKKQIAIRIEETEIKKLKIYAIENNTTIQQIIEDYLMTLTKNQK